LVSTKLNLKAKGRWIETTPPISKPTFVTTIRLVDRAEKTDDDVRALFEPYGKVELVNIPRNKATGDPRGFAFVDMASSDDLDAAIAGLDGATFGSRNIRVSKSVPKGDGDKPTPSATFRKNDVTEGATKLYIGNIPFGKYICRQETLCSARAKLRLS
jgi:RNA recognition motif-containing protein